MGKPQDVEWVLEGSRLWILQTRNIQETQIKIEDHEQLKVNRDIIEAAQKIAEQEKSRQDIREKLHQQKAEKSLAKKEATDKKETPDKTEKDQPTAAAADSPHPQQQSQTPKLGTMQAQLADTMTSEVSKSKEPAKQSEPEAATPDDEKNEKDTEAPFVSKPINRQIVKSIPRSQRQPATPHKGEKLILTGIGASTGAARGTVLIIEDEQDFKEKQTQITPDTILVIPDYISDIENYLKATTGVICDTGGMTSDIAIIAREMNIPCIMGCGIASKMLDTGDELLLDGNVGAIYGQKEKDKSSKTVEEKGQQPSLSELTEDIDLTKEEKQAKEVSKATSKDTTEISRSSDDTQGGIDLTKDSDENKAEAETTSAETKQATQTEPQPKESTTQASPTDTNSPNDTKKVDTTSTTTSASPATKTATKVYVNLANSFARGEKWQDHTQDADGVAVVQIEDIYRRLGKHPDSYIEKNNTNELIDEMAKELAAVCEASQGNQVIASLGSMSVDQYKSLKHGEKYEKWEDSDITDNSAGLERLLKRPKELSSMLKAVRRVRNVEGWRNISIAVEFPGSPEELIEFKKVLSAGGLRRSSTFMLYIVVDTPSVAMVIEDFIEAGIDGAIINMTSLAKLMRAPDPEDESVLKTMENIRSNWRDGELIVQSPNNPDKIIDKAVQSGIKAISCPPSDVKEVREKAAEKERELVFSN
jgi:phosphoenolpyruvate synthase/pyruvate phosphate dikinase